MVAEVASNPVFLFPCSSWWPVCVDKNFVEPDVVHVPRSSLTEATYLAFSRVAKRNNGAACGSTQLMWRPAGFVL
jgi:hypothetical protein